MYPVLYVLLGAVLGVAIGWLVRSTRPAQRDTVLEMELRKQVDQCEGKRSDLLAQVREVGEARAVAEAKRDAAEKLLDEERRLHEQTAIEIKLAQDKALVDLKESFKALSADALKQSAPEFLRLANETLSKFQLSAEKDLEDRQESIKSLVNPLEKQLEAYQQRLQLSETAQAAMLGSVKNQLEALGKQSQTLAQETQQFRMVLNSNQARGRWGEETLRRVVEAAGMSSHCDFNVQTQAGDGKPDLVVNLPGERVIIVDSKVPDLDFLTALDSVNPAVRAESLSAHARKLKETIKALAERDYPAQFANALDHVVLFLPAESLFSAALEGDHDLIIWAASKHRILLATPASLIALLRSVSLSWQQHSQTVNAQQIAEEANNLFSCVTTFMGHVSRMREGLKDATDKFNAAVGSYEKRIRPSGERLMKLGGAPSNKPLPELTPLDLALRSPDDA